MAKQTFLWSLQLTLETRAFLRHRRRRRRRTRHVDARRLRIRVFIPENPNIGTGVKKRTHNKQTQRVKCHLPAPLVVAVPDAGPASPLRSLPTDVVWLRLPAAFLGLLQTTAKRCRKNARCKLSWLALHTKLPNFTIRRYACARSVGRTIFRALANTRRNTKRSDQWRRPL